MPTTAGLFAAALFNPYLRTCCMPVHARLKSARRRSARLYGAHNGDRYLCCVCPSGACLGNLYLMQHGLAAALPVAPFAAAIRPEHHMAVL